MTLFYEAHQCWPVTDWSFKKFKYTLTEMADLILLKEPTAPTLHVRLKQTSALIPRKGDSI